jgi:nucleoside-diphosphate-sugar epimerase
MPNANYASESKRGVAMILRVPGIYAADRLPIERIRAGTPTLRDADDAYTNHIHAEDLARIVLAALARGRSQRVYNASDGSWLKMASSTWWRELRPAAARSRLAPGSRGADARNPPVIHA